MEYFAIQPVLGSAIQFAFEKATLEGKITIGCLAFVSLFSWSVIITKIRQLYVARNAGAKFFKAYKASRDPMEIKRAGTEFDGVPAYELYAAGMEELDYQLARSKRREGTRTLIGSSSFDSVKIAMESAASKEALALEKGMIVLSTAVAGGPFIGLLGTVWGVMETFAGVAKANAASLTAMAPGVAGALIATVIGLLVAIPAMFAYNFMVTTIRSLTQELDGFGADLLNKIQHEFLDEPGRTDANSEPDQDQDAKGKPMVAGVGA